MLLHFTLEGYFFTDLYAMLRVNTRYHFLKMYVFYTKKKNKQKKKKHFFFTLKQQADHFYSFNFVNRGKISYRATRKYNFNGYLCIVNDASSALLCILIGTG